MRMNWNVAAFYHFVSLQDLPALQSAALDICGTHDIYGTLLLAPEGFNGTLAGKGDRLMPALEELDTLLGVRTGELKFSSAASQPFKRLKIRLKKEIITLRAPQANPAERTGQYVAPADWNRLLDHPDIMLIDTRNDYETAVGVFSGAVDPGLKTFTDFTAFAATLDKSKKIAMYCTGGIRCEKASSYLLQEGFSDVYQLQGGILKYLEEVPAAESKWQGTCFVFDGRGSLAHGLAEHPIIRREFSRIADAS